MKRTVRVAAVLASLCVAVWLAGCQSTRDTVTRDPHTANVGNYDPAPMGIDKPRVGVPPFALTKGATGEGLSEIAADQAVTLFVNTDRFDMIERTQLEKLLQEQGLEGIVKAGELARQAQVRGVDYLLLGKVTNFRVKSEKSKAGFGLGDISSPWVSLGGFDYKNKKSRITTEVGVDIRLVDPTTGQTPLASFGEFNRTDEIGAIGIEILGSSAEADAELSIDEDNKGKLLRLALDDAVRKMIPKADRFLKQRTAEKRAAAPPAPPAQAPVTAPAAPPAESAPAAAPPAASETAAKKYCTGCGAQMAAADKFCGKCGRQVE